MDLNQEMKKSSDNRKWSASCNPSASKQLKTCSYCHTTRTPLWRGGPEGPKSLCNACGIKYNKKRREILGLVEKGNNYKKKKKKNHRKSMEAESSRQRLKLMAALGGEMMLRRSGKLFGSLKEEEQAAILLMALSCGSVYV